MSCLVVIEWNCETYEDSNHAVVAVFHSLDDAQTFILKQPKVMPTDASHFSYSVRERAEQYKLERFSVEEFEGARELRQFRVQKNGQLKLDRAAQ